MAVAMCATQTQVVAVQQWHPHDLDLELLCAALARELDRALEPVVDVCRVGDGFLKAPELLGAHLSVVGVLRLDLRVVR